MRPYFTQMRSIGAIPALFALRKGGRLAQLWVIM